MSDKNAILLIALIIPCIPLFALDIYQDIQSDNWRIVSVDSEELVGENGAARNAIDGDTGTYWVTEWKNNNPAHPHEIVIDMGKEYLLSRFYYTPRQNGPNGDIKDYELYTSIDNRNFTLALKGTFSPDKSKKEMMLPGFVRARYVKLKALSEVNDRPWTSVGFQGRYCYLRQIDENPSIRKNAGILVHKSYYRILAGCPEDFGRLGA